MGDSQRASPMDVSGAREEVSAPADLMSFSKLVAGMTHVSAENVERAAAALLGQAGPPQEAARGVGASYHQQR